MSYRQLMLGLLSVLFSLALIHPVSAQSKECFRLSKELQLRILDDVKKGLFNTDYIDSLKGPKEKLEYYEKQCTEQKRRYEFAKETLVLRKRIDKVCGRSHKWINCDTACFEATLPQYVQDIEKACPGEKAMRAAEAAQAEKGRFDGACMDLTMFAQGMSLGLNDEKINESFKVCNAHPKKEACQDTWLDLEDCKVSTGILTCRPTPQQRKERGTSGIELCERIKSRNR